MPRPKPDETNPSIDTQGGAFVGGGVKVDGGDFVGRDQYKFTGSLEDARRVKNWQVIADKVYANWVKNVLEDSLYQNVLIELDMVDKAKAVSHRPWDMVVHRPEQADRPLPAGTTILTVYQEMQSRMLLLGEPGAGKTTMLLQLVAELLAQRQPLDPVPVVFNLSSWAEKQLPLEEWLVDELSRNYDISKQVGRAWVENDELSLFLDGLDEVRADLRAHCVQAINTYRENRASVALCVCCRREEYEALPTQLALNGAVLLRPLTPQQVAAYLENFGPAASGLRAAWGQDAGLQELAESPMLLNIMLMAYRDTEPAAIVQAEAPDQRKQHLFAAYIERMFDRPARTKLAAFTRTDTIHWLSWLARRMVDHSQTVFHLERLQPTWAQPKPQKRRLPVTAYLMLWGPLYGLIGGLTFGLIFELSDSLRFGLTFGLGVGLIFGLIGGLIDGISGGLKEIRPVEQSNRHWKGLRSRLYTALLWGAIFGLFGRLIGATAGQALGLIYSFDGPNFGLTGGLIGGLTGGMIGGIVGGIREIKLIELSSLTWRKLGTRIHFGLVTGLIAGGIVGLILGLLLLVSMLSDGLILGLAGLVGGLAGGLIFGLVGGVISGLFFEPVLGTALPRLVMTQTPNQGIRRSLNSTLVVGLIFGLITGLIAGLIMSQQEGFVAGPPDRFGNRVVYFGQLNGLGYGLGFGSTSGIIGGIIGGVDTVFKHYILRFYLWRSGYMPRHYVRFLDYAAERIFLRKVGGGYIFIHRLVMEYFAELYEESAVDEQPAS